MKDKLGAEAGAFFQSLHTEPIVSIRYNPSKIQRPEKADPVPWSSQGEVLDQRPVFALDPLWHAGCYYVQEASSMFLEQAILQSGLQKDAVTALDLCAAPGGKSTHLASLLHPASLIVSNEPIRARLAPLRENVTKWGSGNVAITSNDPADFSGLENWFDLIVVDAPCSGEGLFRKDRESMQHWSVTACSQCEARQRRILEDVLPSLKGGGTLVYSTCTWNENENEKNIQWLQERFGMESVRLDIRNFPGIIETPNSGYAFFPHLTRGEGFFLAVLKKPGVSNASKMKLRNAIFHDAKEESLRDWFKDSLYRVYQRGMESIALQPGHMDRIEWLSENLDVRHAGISLAESKGKSLVPQHGLAMWNALNRSVFPEQVLSREDALVFLRKEPLAFQAEKGWMLATYQGHPLGWMNHLGSRINNYYPSEWRLRMK